MLYAKINVKSNHFLFLTSLESPLNKGGSEGVWKYRWLPKEDKEKEKTRRENLSKFIYQLANTCFTAMVVVAAVGLVLGVDDAKPYALLLGVGLFSTIFLALFADNILKKK